MGSVLTGVCVGQVLAALRTVKITDTGTLSDPYKV